VAPFRWAANYVRKQQQQQQQHEAGILVCQQDMELAGCCRQTAYYGRMRGYIRVHDAAVARLLVSVTVVCNSIGYSMQRQ
jgi:hypothetical protein